MPEPAEALEAASAQAAEAPPGIQSQWLQQQSIVDESNYFAICFILLQASTAGASSGMAADSPQQAQAGVSRDAVIRDSHRFESDACSRAELG